jgi:hypothetical protein
MNTLSSTAPRTAHPLRARILALIGAILLLLASASEAIAGDGCAHHGAGAAEQSTTAHHADAGTGPDHERFPGEHRACTCIGDCLAPTAILPPDATTEPASWPAESRTPLLPAPALDLHGCAPYTLPYSQAPPLAG